MKLNSVINVTTGAALVSLVGTGVVNAQTTLDATTTLPPDAKPGECWVKAIKPAEYKTETVDVVKTEASEKIEIIPAKYDMVEEKLLVKDASFKLVPVAAVYENGSEKIEVRPTYNIWTTAGGKQARDALVQSAGGLGIDLAAATPGSCYAEHYVAPQTKTEKVRVLVKEATETIEVVPAKYEWAEERVLVKEASKKVVEVPAVYDNVTEKVLVSAAHSVWKKGTGPVQRIDNTTGEIMCLVEVPAKYKTVTKRVVKTPASTKTVEIPAEYAVQKVRKLVSPATERRSAVPAKYTEVERVVPVSDASVRWFAKGDAAAAGKATGREICLKNIPAEYKTVTKRVIKTAPSVKKVEIPAEYKTVKVRKLVSPPQEKRIAIPETRQTVTKRVKVSEETLQWQAVLCETNMTPDLITRIQKALQKAGHNPGPIDGAVGRGTLDAAAAYQSAKGLSRGGLTMETLKSLGVM